MPDRRSRLWPIPLLLALAAGCEEPMNPSGKVNTPPPSAPKKAPAPAPNDKDDFIVGKRTQDIRKVSTEEKKGGRVTPPRIVSKDPITLPGNAYVSIIGRNSMYNMQHAIDLFHATNGRYPKDYDEFMQVIIKENNVVLPKLPRYQNYAYDEPTHSLVIIEYPDLKENP
jgi:hypothetical protein